MKIDVGRIICSHCVQALLNAIASFTIVFFLPFVNQQICVTAVCVHCQLFSNSENVKYESQQVRKIVDYPLS